MKLIKPASPCQQFQFSAVGLVVLAPLHWRPALTAVAAAVLAVESLVFIEGMPGTARRRPSS